VKAPTWRDFLSHPDPSWKGFTPAEADALAGLRREWALMGTADRFHAGVPVLRDDGAMRVVPFTVDPWRVDLHAGRYWRKERIAFEQFVLTPRQDA
jgi:hypothetical protein